MMVKGQKWGRKFLVKEAENLTIEQVYETAETTNLEFTIEDGQLWCMVPAE